MASSSKLCAAPNNGGVLPLDALYEILVRLPAKLLCRLRTVCRLWRSLLSDPCFAAIHAARHPGPLIIASYDTGRDVLVDIMDLSGQIVKQVRGVQGDRVVSKPLDLVCVKKIDSSSGYRVLNPILRDVFHLPDQLLNPATGAVYQIPDSFAKEHVALPVSLVNEPRYAFGQVPATGEYKVFRKIFHFPLESGKRQQLLFEVCTLNSSGTNAGWRATPPLEERIQYSHLSTVIINGVVYSLCGEPHHSITFEDKLTDKDLIITFDLDTEKWGPYIRGPPISFPDDTAQMFHDLGLPNIKQLSLAKLNGSLAAVHGPAPSIDIWMLTDMGKDLWVKQYSIQFEQYDKLQYVHPLVVLPDGRIVLHKEDMRYLQIYDPRTNKLTNSVATTHFSAVSMYEGNLLSLE